MRYKVLPPPVLVVSHLNDVWSWWNRELGNEGPREWHWDQSIQLGSHSVQPHLVQHPMVQPGLLECLLNFLCLLKDSLPSAIETTSSRHI